MAEQTKAVAKVLSPREAVERIKEKFPDEATVLDNVVRMNIASLTTDDIFTLRDKDGEIRAFKSFLRLSLQNGGLVNIPVGGGTPIVSAEGYEMWSEKAAASVIFPTEVLVEGRPVQNPAPLKDPVTGKNKGWVVRAAAFRYTPMGIPQVSDRTVIFDIDNRKNIEFLAKAKDYPQAFRVLPAESGPPETEGGTWIKYGFDEAAALWVDSSHKEALRWFADISQMIKNSLQLAQTHAARNALKHLSGLQKSPGKAPVWDVPVVAFRPVGGSVIKWDPTTYKNLQTKVSALISGERTEDFRQIELVSKGVDSLGEEDYAVETQGAEPGDKVEPVEVGPGVEALPPAEEKKTEEAPPARKHRAKATEKGPLEQAMASLSEDDKRVFQNLEVTKKEFPVEFSAVKKTLGITTDDLTVDQAKEIQKQVSLLIDSGT